MTCSSIETGPFEICNENDGTASINGQNTGTPMMNIYLGYRSLELNVTKIIERLN